MIRQEILEREKGNYNKVYLYIDTENDLCYAYDFSAYLVTKLFETQKLETKEEVWMETVVYTLQLPLQFVADQFDAPHTLIDAQFIKFIIDRLPHCIQWKFEFEELKMQREQSNVRNKRSFLDFFRFDKK